MIELLLQHANIRTAYQKVVSKGGSAGVDGISFKALRPQPAVPMERPVAAIREARYIPSAILGMHS